jgi:group I intron endonuclease
MNKKYHYIYKTTCLITNKFYIGMHSTDNLEDGYIGSGKILWFSIDKYGKENHKVEILEHCFSREILIEREIFLVNEEILQDKMCMNLCLGGGGGTFNKETSRKGTNTFKNKMKNDFSFNEKWSRNISNRMLNNTIWLNRIHSEETKKKMSESQQGKQNGEKNSQFGTCWIYNQESLMNKKIKKKELESYLEQGWLKGRKIF